MFWLTITALLIVEHNPLYTVKPKLLELQAAKEILAEVYDIQIWEVEDLIQQRIVDFRLMGMEFRLYAPAGRAQEN